MQNQNLYNKQPDGRGAIDEEFEIWELKRVLCQVLKTAPRKDGISYMMIKYAEDIILKAVMDLFNMKKGGYQDHGNMP